MINDTVLDAMRARAKAVRTRAAIRRWQYRQRHHAAGVWFQIRHVLASAKEAYVISFDDAQRLLAEGYKPAPCGARIHPEKTVLFVGRERLDRVASRRAIPVRLGPDFLLATAIALIQFDQKAPLV